MEKSIHPHTSNCGNWWEKKVVQLLTETEDAICCHPQNSRVTTTELMYIEFSDNIGCIGEGQQNSFNNTAA